VTNPRFSADSTRLAGNSSDGVWVWNADTGALVAGPFAGATISGSTDDPFSPDRRRLVAVDDNRVIIFDLASGQPVGEPLRFHAGNAGSPVFSPDGSLVATVSNGGTAQLWDAHTTRPVGPALVHRNTIMRGVRFTRDGQRLLTWNRMAVCVWDVATGRQLVEPIPAGLDIDGAVFSEDGSRIATSARVGRQVRLWDSSSGQLLSEPAVGAVGFYDQPTFHLSARFLATGYVAEGYAAQVMALPPSTAREPVPEWLLRLATTLAGAEIDQSGALCERASEAKALDAIRRELASQRPDAPYVEWGRWILADRATRPIGPGFKITTAEAEELNSDTSERDLRALDRRANELERIGQFAEAGEIARQGLELARQSRGGESRVTAYWAQRLAWILIQAKQPAEAEPAARAAIAIRERLLDADDPVLALVRQRLGWALLDQQRHAEAEPVLLTAYEAYQRVEARASLSATQKSWKWQTAELLARLYEATQQPAKAAEWRQKAAPAAPPPAPPGNP
jgi:tetratricopeptide (TPR) repeat protein